MAEIPCVDTGHRMDSGWPRRQHVTASHGGHEHRAVLVDTDPTQRTITAANDPNDTLLFNILSAQGLINLLIDAGSLLTADEPLWKQFEYFFTTPIPPASQNNGQQSQIQVYHSDPTGVVNIYVPQQYDKAYA